MYKAIALSLSPEEALGYLARIHSILILLTPPPIDILNRRIYIHSLGFPDDLDLRRGCEEILEEFGFNAETFPAFAIQGWVDVGEIISYDCQKFSQDRDAHGHEETLRDYQARFNISSEVWGVRFSDTYIFNEPIIDVLPTGNIGENGFWQLRALAVDFAEVTGIFKGE